MDGLPALGAVFAGGLAGAVARAGLAELAPHDPGRWPWATLVANLAGAFLLGYVVTWLGGPERDPDLRHPLLGAGLCGALTTFSTLQLELLELLDGGRLGLAAAYAAVSLAGGLALAAAAMALGHRHAAAR